VMVLGEITTNAHLDYQKIIRGAIKVPLLLLHIPMLPMLFF